MQIGMVGLGRMGANIVRRLLKAGHQAVVYDRDPAPGARLASEGATPASNLADVIEKLQVPRTVWIMLPAGDATEAAIREIEQAMAAPGFYDDRTASQPIIDRHHALMWQVGDLMHQWEELQTLSDPA